MFVAAKKEERFLELMIVLVSLAIACLFYYIQGYKLVVLHLFYLPVILTGFFLGRYRAGILAFLCLIAIVVMAALAMNSMPSNITPLVMGLAIVVWGASLGLTSLLVGSLSDERRKAMEELHDAYVGVVEVLSQYLQSANPLMKARSIRVAELSQLLAAKMKLSPKQIDDIRVAALLYEMGNVEVTTKVIHRAVYEFNDKDQADPQHTFRGKDLVFSLVKVLSGATPLLLELQGTICELQQEGRLGAEAAHGCLGARIIAAAREYDALVHGKSGEKGLSPEEALRWLAESAAASGAGDEVIQALKSCVAKQKAGTAEIAVAPSQDQAGWRNTSSMSGSTSAL
jgi:hypothetical protein